jgi:hypothetical protein
MLRRRPDYFLSKIPFRHTSHGPPFAVNRLGVIDVDSHARLDSNTERSASLHKLRSEPAGFQR